MTDPEIAAAVRAKYLLCAALAYYPIILVAVVGVNLAHRSEAEQPTIHWSRTFYPQAPDTNSSMCKTGGQALDGGDLYVRDHAIKASRCWEPI
jgi:hypothetical protein